MNASIEFLERVAGEQFPRHLLTVPKCLPVGIEVGLEMEIHYRQYKVVAINPIAGRIQNDFMKGEITYQIHVELVKD